jgi:hypothetical protein
MEVFSQMFLLLSPRVLRPKLQQEAGRTVANGGTLGGEGAKPPENLESFGLI